MIYCKIEVLKFCPKSPMLDFMVNRSYFFIFVTWYSWIIVWILGGIHENGDSKKLKLWWYSWKTKKKAPTTGRRDEIPPEAEKGPAWAPGGFNLFYFCLPWNHQSFNFSAHIFVKPPKILKKKWMKPGHKKNEWFPIKT